MIKAIVHAALLPLEWIFQIVQYYLGDYIIVDDWYKLGMATSCTGLTVTSVAPQPVIGFSVQGGIAETVLSNPILWISAFFLVVINIFSVWHKVRDDKRKEARHLQEMRQDEEKHKAELSIIQNQ